MNESYASAIQDEIDADTDSGAPVGLWSERWFRRLTIFNASVVTASAIVGLAGLLGTPSEVLWPLILLVPVVPATAFIPLVSLFIVAAAAALSTLNMIGKPQKGVRFVRAMTVWGTAVLGTQLVIGLLWLVLAAVGSSR